MSFLKKTLASFGIGSAKVDSILHHEPLYPGSHAKVTVHVYGGSTAQEVDNISLKLCCRYISEEYDRRGGSETNHSKRRIARNYVLNQWQLPYAFTINPGEERTFEVELDIPWNTPVTIHDAKVWLETGLDIDNAIDPSDKDILTVRPDPILDSVLSALEAQGLRIRQVECEAVKGFEMPFVQEFELVPTTGPYHGVWRELEFVAYRTEDTLKLWFEIDRSRKGLQGMLASLLGSNSLKRELTIRTDLPPESIGNKVLEYLDKTSAGQEVI